MELLQRKNIIHKIKNSLSNRLDIEEKIREHEDIAIETI